jgi:hypothetical protein
MPKTRITNMRVNRRRLLGAWFELWLDKALKDNHDNGKSFPGWDRDDTRKVLLTLKDLRDDCESDRTGASLVETGGFDAPRNDN